jgi:hypothetical protein
MYVRYQAHAQLTDKQKKCHPRRHIRGWHFRGDELKEQEHLAISLYFIFAQNIEKGYKIS